MVIATKVIITVANLKARGDFSGVTENYMMVNGLMEKSMVQEYGKERKEILILVNGKMVVLMAMVFISG